MVPAGEELHPLYGTKMTPPQSLDVQVEFTSKKIAVLYIPTEIEVEVDSDQQAEGLFQLANLGENTLSWQVINVVSTTESGGNSTDLLPQIVSFNSSFMQAKEIASATGETSEVEFGINASNVPSADYMGYINVSASFGAAPFPVIIPLKVSVKPGTTDFTRCDIKFSSTTSGELKIIDRGVLVPQNVTVSG